MACIVFEPIKTVSNIVEKHVYICTSNVEIKVHIFPIALPPMTIDDGSSPTTEIAMYFSINFPKSCMRKRKKSKTNNAHIYSTRLSRLSAPKSSNGHALMSHHLLQLLHVYFPLSKSPCTIKPSCMRTVSCLKNIMMKVALIN